MLLVLVITMLVGCSGSDKKYECKYCGRKIEAYRSYHNGDMFIILVIRNFLSK